MRDDRWSEEECGEVDEMFALAIGEAGKPTGERVTHLLELLDDALNAQRRWAYELRRTLMYRGATATIRNEIKSRASVGVSYNGRIVTKPRMVGGSTITEAGERVSALKLWDELTFDEIRSRIIEDRKVRAAYDVNIAIGSKLLGLETLVPGARTPGEACERLGTTIDAYLGEEAA